MTVDPHQILQTLLDRQSAALMAEDAGDYGRTLSLPYRRIFANREFLIETTEEMLGAISSIARSIKGLGGNMVIRLATSAEQLGPDYIAGTFVTHALRNATPIFESVENRCVLKRQPDESWAIIEYESNIIVERYPVDLVRFPIQHHPVPMVPHDDPRRASQTAIDIYQIYLERTARTVAEDDFAGYCALMDYPYEAHGSNLDQVIATPDDLRSFYNVLRSCNDGTTGDRIIRVAEKAEFLGADIICGYHTATVYRGDVETVAPVQSCMILKRTDTTWRLKSVNNSIDNTTYPFSMYQPGGTLRTHLEILKRTTQ